jgi:hypothetical protein
VNIPATKKTGDVGLYKDEEKSAMKVIEFIVTISSTRTILPNKPQTYLIFDA